MTTEELTQQVWALIDEHSMDFDKRGWIDFLEELATDANMKADAAKDELDEELEEGS
jgi:hypothetical protein